MKRVGEPLEVWNGPCIEVEIGERVGNEEDYDY